MCPILKLTQMKIGQIKEETKGKMQGEAMVENIKVDTGVEEERKKEVKSAANPEATKEGEEKKNREAKNEAEGNKAAEGNKEVETKKDLEIRKEGEAEKESGPKILFHVIRHGEAYHNIACNVQQRKVLDPPLTTKGEKQCEALREKLPSRKISMIFCSPTRRTLQTALISFSQLIEKEKIPIYAVPDLREWGSAPVCTGTPLSFLKEEPEYSGIDWTLVPEGWEENKEIYMNKARPLRLKHFFCKMGRAALKGESWTWPDGATDDDQAKLTIDFEHLRKENNESINIAIVTHADFMKSVFPAAKGWWNASPKIFELVPDFKDISLPYEIKETKESLEDQATTMPMQIDAKWKGRTNDPRLRPINDHMPYLIREDKDLRPKVAVAREEGLDDMFKSVWTFFHEAENEKDKGKLRRSMMQLQERTTELRKQDDLRIEKEVLAYAREKENEKIKKEGSAKMFDYLGAIQQKEWDSATHLRYKSQNVKRIGWPVEGAPVDTSGLLHRWFGGLVNPAEVVARWLEGVEPGFGVENKDCEAEIQDMEKLLGKMELDDVDWMDISKSVKDLPETVEDIPEIVEDLLETVEDVLESVAHPPETAVEDPPNSKVGSIVADSDDEEMVSVPMPGDER